MSEASLFETFDEGIGVEGYYEHIRRGLFPHASANSIDLAAYQAQERIFKKGSIFSRVRRVKSQALLDRLFADEVSIEEFLPPRPEGPYAREGRLNHKDEKVFYLSDHPLVAMNECDVSVGDYFLLSQFRLKKDMCFLYIPSLQSRLSRQISEAFSAQGESFYPVLNKVRHEFLTFAKHHGLAYDTTRTANLRVENGWRPHDSMMNLAVSEKAFDDVGLLHSSLVYCGLNYTLHQHVSYRPVTGSACDRVALMRYRDDEKAFEKALGKWSRFFKRNNERIKRHLDKGRHTKFDESAVRFSYKP